MAVVHRYLDELLEIEQNKTFCGQPIHPQSYILIIGTFNPSDEGGVMPNDAEWFYGRLRNKFWRYLPIAMGAESLHSSDEGTVGDWRQFCIANRIVIIDLIKSIETEMILENFNDRSLEDLIDQELENVDYFDIPQAFRGVTFERVIYSLRWTDNHNAKLRRIRNIIDNQLQLIGCIEDENQIRKANAPWGNDAQPSWTAAVQDPIGIQF